MPRQYVVNVASVPQRSPFRYPGGKTWLVPVVRTWLKAVGGPTKHLVEPFAGGAIVGLTAAFESLVSKTLLVELDPDVAAVWQTLIENHDGEWLASKITKFQLSNESVKGVLGRTPSSTREHAFQTIIRNRVCRGGILADGAGLMKEGENGKGLSSRWYPETLAKRIYDIGTIREKISFKDADGLDILQSMQNDESAVFFVDPPYKVAGARLYRFSELDHLRLFKMLAQIRGNFLATYDDSAEIRSLASGFNFEVDTVAMKNTHHQKMNELLISKSLDWLRESDISAAVSEQFSLQIASE